MKMKDKEFKQLLKKYTPKRIIDKYCNLKIDLTSKQLDKVIKLKNGVK